MHRHRTVDLPATSQREDTTHARNARPTQVLLALGALAATPLASLAHAPQARAGDDRSVVVLGAGQPDPTAGMLQAYMFDTEALEFAAHAPCAGPNAVCTSPASTPHCGSPG